MDLQPLEVKKDKRGSLIEAFKLPNDGQLFYVVAKPGETRGNHYHTRKTERFLVILGSATMFVRNRETGNTMKAEVNGLQPIIMTITPNHTHCITAGDDGAIFVVWVDEQFNKEDADTIAEEV